jgi:hypothetical protein
MADHETVNDDGPVDGWGSLCGIAEFLAKERPCPGVLATLARQNKPGGFMCVSCAWTKPANHSPLECLPDGCVGGYYPELNVLVPLSYHDIQSKTPASKAVPASGGASGDQIQLLQQRATRC